MIDRVTVDGAYLSVDGQPFRVRGATYATFLPRLDGEPYPERWQVKADFISMVRAGMNVVRTYTVPPRDVVEAAEEAGLRLIVGIHYEDWRDQPNPGRSAHRRVLDQGRRALDAAMRQLGGEPAILALSVGNEVPGDVVRLHGIEGVRDVLGKLLSEAHEADPSLLVTYTNYPTTEYLWVEEQDLISFNVFLEQPGALRSYLARLQRISAGLPVVITELGLASDVHGREEQAASLLWQLRAVDEAGCAGATVFSWTDEWAVGGVPVEGWGFGLTDEERVPKPALDVARRWAAGSVRDLRRSWPSMSVVVCAFDEERRIGRCLESLRRSDYPGLEIIVCDDGSTDDTISIARTFPFRVVELPHRGLAVARNAGLEAAGGEIVAFIDADAWCHPEWPYRLALSLEEEGVVGTGGPNLPVPVTGLVERAVASSPGSPAEVLFSDDRAEHVPGCNMAFRREALLALGGFDPVFTAAGDDVDICWRLLDGGHRIAFSAAAQVRHHRRDTVPGYLRQQLGYGRAERLLSGRHPHRFGRMSGHPRWAGSIYGGIGVVPKILRPIVYHGSMGLAPYQGRVPRRSETAMTLVGALLPLVVIVGFAAPLLAFASPWFAAGPLLVLLVLGTYAATVAASCRTDRNEQHPLAFRLLVGFLHVAQPLARAWGRASGRRPRTVPVSSTGWSGDRRAWLAALERDLAARGCQVRKGRPQDRFDLRVAWGPFVTARLTTAVAWGWFPRVRFALRPRPLALGAVGIASALIATGRGLGWAIFVAVALASAFEAAALKMRVDRSVRLTTEER